MCGEISERSLSSVRMSRMGKIREATTRKVTEPAAESLR
jgi:hypothetical protein